MHVTSGTTAVSTSGDTAVTLIAATSIRAKCESARHVRITNEGGVAGFFALNGGAADSDWKRMPADSVTITLYDNNAIVSVKVKRIASGTDMTGLYAEVWG